MGRSRVDLGGAGDIKLQEANISGETQFVGGGSTTSLVACAEINDEVFRSQPPCDLPPKALVSAGNQGNLTVMIRTAIATRRSGHGTDAATARAIALPGRGDGSFEFLAPIPARAPGCREGYRNRY
jgi:hypothetical protein